MAGSGLATAITLPGGMELPAVGLGTYRAAPGDTTRAAVRYGPKLPQRGAVSWNLR
jgi:diketogulonate reductase-like aldo/keto reductase